MTKVKPTLWSISDDVASLTSVRISGEILDTHGCFVICHTYQTRSNPTQTLDFPFYLHDYGLVTGYKVSVAGSEISAKVCGKADVPKPSHELIKQYYDNSATDSFVCRVTDVPADTTVQIFISFVQNLHLEGVHTLGSVIPTILAPKHFLSEETSGVHSAYPVTVQQFALEVDIALSMSVGGVSNVLSPSHAAIGFTRTDDKSGKIILNPSQKPYLDVDLVLIITMKDTLESLLPACYIEKINEEEEIVMVSAIPKYKSTFKFDENNEEGHPDPREVLFLIDPHQMTLDEIKIVLNESLNQIDAQIYFNFLILGLPEQEKPLFFHKSLQATKTTISRAREILNGQLFSEKFSEAQASLNTLASNLKPIYLMDVVSEEIPRILFLLSRAYISHPSELIDLVKKNPQPIFSFGLGVDSNYALLKTISSRSNGECEIVYNESGEERNNELVYKISRQLARIIKPEHENVVIDWGDLNANMLSQTPSETLKYIHFNTGDIFSFFALCKHVPKNKFNINVSYKFDPTVEKKKQELNAVCDPATQRVEKPRLALFQMLGELEHPDDSTVRQKKIAEKMFKCGAASAYTSFVASENLSGGSTVSLISVTDTLELEIQETKKHIKYTPSDLLKFQAFHTAKPSGVDLGEVEKGSEMKRLGGFQRNQTLNKGPISTRGNRFPTGQQRSKKLEVIVPWDQKTNSAEFYKTINALLNKMSKDNFDTLKDKLLAMKAQIDSDQTTLEVIVKLIYEKALFAPRFAPLYADLCAILAKELQSIQRETSSERPQTKDFKTCILEHCKTNFQSCFLMPKEDENANLSEEDKQEKEFKRKLRMSCNITFIGELYIRQLLRPMIVHLVIRSLLEEDKEGNLGKPESQQLELAVKLLTTIEGFKAYPNELEKAERYFDHLSALSEDDTYDMRIRYLIKDILDLRNKDWEDEKKKKKQAEQQKSIDAAKQSQLKSSQELNSSGGPNSPKGRGRDEKPGYRRDDRGRPGDSKGGGKQGGGSFFDRHPQGGSTGGGGNRDYYDNRGGGKSGGGGRGRDQGRGGYSPSVQPNRQQQQQQPQPQQPADDGFSFQKGGKGKNTGRTNFDNKVQNPHQQPQQQQQQPQKQVSPSTTPTTPTKAKPWHKNTQQEVQQQQQAQATNNVFAQLAGTTSQPQGKGQPQGGKNNKQQQGKQQPQAQQQPTQPQPQPVVPAKERKLKMDQEKLDKQVGNMLEEYVSEVDIPEAIEYIEKIAKEAGDIGYVFASVLTRCYNYRKPKDQECCNKLLTHILTEKKKLVEDEDLLFAVGISVPIVDELSLDAPNIVQQFSSSIVQFVTLNRLTIDQIMVVMTENKESGFALKVILEVANSLISTENGKTLVDKIDFGSIALSNNGIVLAKKKYPQLEQTLARF